MKRNQQYYHKEPKKEKRQYKNDTSSKFGVSIISLPAVQLTITKFTDILNFVCENIDSTILRNNTYRDALTLYFY